MNELIVWDKALNCFHSDGRVKLENGVLKPIGSDYTIHKGVGIKDINDKSIYADSSIVELKFKDTRQSELKTAIGYFSQNQELHCWEFVLLHEKTRRCRLNFIQHIDWIHESRIIDTIQKNKLGLIK